MIHLHLIGYTADLDHLVLDLDDEDGGGRYRLVVDGDLFATLDEVRRQRQERGKDVGVWPPEGYVSLDELDGLLAPRAETAPTDVATPSGDARGPSPLLEDDLYAELEDDAVADPAPVDEPPRWIADDDEDDRDGAPGPGTGTNRWRRPRCAS